MTGIIRCTGSRYRKAQLLFFFLRSSINTCIFHSDGAGACVVRHGMGKEQGRIGQVRSGQVRIWYKHTNRVSCFDFHHSLFSSFLLAHVMRLWSSVLASKEGVFSVVDLFFLVYFTHRSRQMFARCLLHH